MQLNPPKKRWRKFGISLACWLVAYLLLCTYLAYKYVHPHREVSMTPNWVRDITIPGSHAQIPVWASPGLALKHGKPVVFVLAYGYGGTRESWASVMADLTKHGFESVAPCMPGQEVSLEQTVGFGRYEARTILDTVKWVRGQYSAPPKIILLGVSMGGAASWLASEQDPTIDAVVTEGAYAQFDEAMNNWLSQKMPGSPVYLKPMIWIASAMAKINPSEIIPSNSAAKWHKPALVIQGSDDKLIPMEHAERLAKAANCPLWIVPNASHAQCFAVASKEYIKRLSAIANSLKR